MEKIAAILLIVGLVAGAAGGFGGAFVTSISSLQSENQDLNSKLSTSQSDLSTSQSELSSSKDQLTKSQSDLTAEQSKTTDLNTKLSSANEMIEGLEAKVAEAQKSFEEADAKLIARSGVVALTGVLEGRLTITIFTFVASTEDGGWDGTGYVTITDTRDNKIILFNFFDITTLEKSGNKITLTGEIFDTNQVDRYLSSKVLIVTTFGRTDNETITVSFPTAKPPANPISITGFAGFCEPGECEEE